MHTLSQSIVTATPLLIAGNLVFRSISSFNFHWFLRTAHKHSLPGARLRQESLAENEQPLPDQEDTYLNRGACVLSVCGIVCSVYALLILGITWFWSLYQYEHIVYVWFILDCVGHPISSNQTHCLVYSSFNVTKLLTFLLLELSCTHLHARTHTCYYHRRQCGAVQQSGCRAHHRRRENEAGIVFCEIVVV